MIYLIIGAVCLLVGGIFFWLNSNSPVQTKMPMFLLPMGVALVIVGLAKVFP